MMLRTILVATAIAAFGAHALAGDTEDCTIETGPRAIAACTALIDGGKLTGKALANAHYVRANALLPEGKVAEAGADMSKAVQLDGDNPQIRFAQGNFYMMAKSDYKNAIAEYDKAIALKPDFALAYFSRGFVHEAQKDLKGALADYKKAAELDPEPGNAERAVENIESMLEKAAKEK